jgi:hypothetical protein
VADFQSRLGSIAGGKFLILKTGMKTGILYPSS